MNRRWMGGGVADGGIGGTEERRRYADGGTGRRPSCSTQLYNINKTGTCAVQRACHMIRCMGFTVAFLYRSMLTQYGCTGRTTLVIVYH